MQPPKFMAMAESKGLMEHHIALAPTMGEICRRRIPAEGRVIGTRPIDGSHDIIYLRGWLWCTKCGAASHVGSCSGRVAASA